MPQPIRNAQVHSLTYRQKFFCTLGLMSLLVLGLLACTQAAYADNGVIVASCNVPATIGTIDPTGRVEVPEGSSQTFTAAVTPAGSAQGYRFKKFVLNGVDQPYSGPSITIPVTGLNNTIVANFDTVYHITASVNGTGGTIAPSGTTPVNYGGSLPITITPNSNFQVHDVLVDGKSVGAVTLYTFSSVDADHTIVATFAAGTHSLTLLFDQSAYLGKVWLQVQDAKRTFVGKYANDTQQVTIAAGDMMSAPVLLSDIGAGGLKVTYASSANLFIFYDDPTNNNRKAAPSQMTSQQRFMPFELTMVGNSGDGGDLTAINYFSAPLSLRSYSTDPTQNPQLPALQEAGFGGASAGYIGRQLLRDCQRNPLALVKNAQGGIIRVLGPSNDFGTGVANPWPSFVPYTQSINAAGQQTKIQAVNAFNFNTVDPAYGTPTYTFGTDNMVATASADGSLSITGRITVSVNGTIRTGVAHTNPPLPASGYWDGATFAFNVDTGGPEVGMLFNDAIYREVRNEAVTFTNEGVDTSAWGQFRIFCHETWMNPDLPYQPDGTKPNYNPSLDDLFRGGTGGNAYFTTQNLFIGEVATGLLGGFFNSDYKVGSVAIKDMPSYQWWTLNPMVAFSTIQPAHPFYSLYSGVIYDLSKNTVYGTPYSDRFGKVLINSVNYTKNGTTFYVNFWKIGIGAPLPQALVTPELMLLLDN
jgi:hypothetical protein